MYNKTLLELTEKRNYQLEEENKNLIKDNEILKLTIISLKKHIELLENEINLLGVT